MQPSSYTFILQIFAGLWILEFFLANLPRDDDVVMVSEQNFCSQSVIGFAIATIILSDVLYVKKIVFLDSKVRIFFSIIYIQGTVDSEATPNNSSDSELGSCEEEGTDYLDSEASDMEDLLQSEELELPQALPQEINQQHLQVILTWVVYSVLVWQ